MLFEPVCGILSLRKSIVTGMYTSGVLQSASNVTESDSESADSGKLQNTTKLKVTIFLFLFLFFFYFFLKIVFLPHVRIYL